MVDVPLYDPKAPVQFRMPAFGYGYENGSDVASNLYQAPVAPPLPQYLPNYVNGSDLASDLYATSGVANLGGLAAGQGYGLWDQFKLALSDLGNSDFLKGAIGTKDAPGWAGLAVGGASALANSYMGMKQYGLAKQTLEQNKRMFEQNYAAQRQTTNTRLEDRQRARVASNSGAYQSVGDYMAQNKVA